MHRVVRSLALAAIVTAIGGSAAWALSPDDAIYLTQQGVDDEVIIAKICADGEAWDLSSDDIVYLRDDYVDEDVIEALMDPAAAANRFGFALGDGDRYDDSNPRTAYVYSLGYYYGPISRNYFCDPFFYSYLYCDRFSFGFSYWPSYYASNCFPYYYGYYAYPYFYYPSTSFYYGYNYCGSYYDRFRTRYRDGYVAGGSVRWRDWSNRSGQVARGGDRSTGSWRVGDRQRGDWRTGDSRSGQRGGLAGGERIRNRTGVRDPIAYDNPQRRIQENRTWVPRGRDQVQRPRRTQEGWSAGDNTQDPGRGSRREPRVIRGGGANDPGGGRRTWNPDGFRRGNQAQRGDAPDQVDRRYAPRPGRGEDRGWGRRGEDVSRGRQIERAPERAPDRAPVERSHPDMGHGNGGRWDGGHADNGHGGGQQNRGGEGRRR